MKHPLEWITTIIIASVLTFFGLAFWQTGIVIALIWLEERLLFLFDNPPSKELQ